MNEIPTLFQVIGIMVVVITCMAFVISYCLMVNAVMTIETNVSKIIQYINKQNPSAKIDLPKPEDK